MVNGQVPTYYDNIAYIYICMSGCKSSNIPVNIETVSIKETVVLLIFFSIQCAKSKHYTKDSVKNGIHYISSTRVWHR